MAKLICKKCSKIFSDVSAFCPKCGAPAEISGRPEFIGGRQMAMAGRSVRSRAKGSFDGKLFDEDALEVEDRLTHSHRSFDDICSDDESPLGKMKNVSEKIRTAQTSKTPKNAKASKSSVSFMFNSLSGNSDRSSGRKAKEITKFKMMWIIIAVIIFINILSVVIAGISSFVSDISYRVDNVGWGDNYKDYGVAEVIGYDGESFGITDEASDFMDIVAAQLEYRSSNIDPSVVAELSDEERVMFFSTWIQRELSVLEPYMNCELSDDDNFNDCCDNYIYGLNCQLNALDYYTIDLEEFQYEWITGYSFRINSIIDMYEMYGMSLSSDLYEKYCMDSGKLAVDVAELSDLMAIYFL